MCLFALHAEDVVGLHFGEAPGGMMIMMIEEGVLLADPWLLSVTSFWTALSRAVRLRVCSPGQRLPPCAAGQPGPAYMLLANDAPRLVVMLTAIRTMCCCCRSNPAVQSGCRSAPDRVRLAHLYSRKHRAQTAEHTGLRATGQHRQPMCYVLCPTHALLQPQQH